MHICRLYALDKQFYEEQEYFLFLTFTDRTTLSVRDVVAFTVEDAALGCKAHGHPTLTAAEATGIHPEHVPVMVLHSVESAGRLRLCKTQ